MRWFVILIVLMLTLPGMAQENNDSLKTVSEKQKLTKEEKKAAREARKEARELERSRKQFEQLQKQIITLDSIRPYLEERAFVLEATAINQGGTNSIPSEYNFIAVLGDVLTLQLGAWGGIGLNDLGGVTVEMEILEYEIQEGPGAGNVMLLIKARSVLTGAIKFRIRISEGGKFWASMDRSSITLRGDFRSWENATFYKGQKLRIGRPR